MIHATILLALSAPGRPGVAPPKPEIFTETVADGEILKVIPKGALFTTQSGPDGKPEPLPRTRILQYWFKAEVKGKTVYLSQVADEFGKKDFFDLDGADSYGEKRDFDLELGKPAVIRYNVPGGGPIWTLTLESLDSK